jgi:2-amino-4-hydroxy-6-hydroxymethyldihydropteridine diphosphokinase
VEKQLGKKVVRENGPRVIDLDLLVYGDEVINLPELTLPHTGILNRDFVLKPLTDLNPMLTHPAWNGQSLQNAMDKLKECFLIEVDEVLYTW